PPRRPRGSPTPRARRPCASSPATSARWTSPPRTSAPSGGRSTPTASANDNRARPGLPTTSRLPPRVLTRYKICPWLPSGSRLPGVGGVLNEPFGVGCTWRRGAARRRCRAGGGGGLDRRLQHVGPLEGGGLGRREALPLLRDHRAGDG